MEYISGQLKSGHPRVENPIFIKILLNYLKILLLKLTGYSTKP